MNYKTYAEAKIANPDREIVTTGKKWNGCDDAIGIFEKKMKEHQMGDDAWVICNPADHCSSIKEFLEAGFKFAIGDIWLSGDNILVIVDLVDARTNKYQDADENRYILSAVALNGGCKIPAKPDAWTIYNNTLPLCELTDDQAGMLFNAWRGGAKVELLADNDSWCDAVPDWELEISYRIKPKSEREMFIDEAISHAIKPETQSAKQMFGELFDSGKFKYIDNTQHFGENI